MEFQSIQLDAADHRLALFFQRGHQLVERRSKCCDAILLQLFRDRVQVDAHRLQAAQCGGCFIEIFAHSVPDNPAVIFECVERFRRQRIDRFRADEILYVKNIGILWILSSGARPKRPLDPRPALTQRREAFAVKDLEKTLINHFGIGDGDFPEQR